MRIGDGVQGGVIAAQLLAPASTASGRPPAAAGGFAVRDSVTLSSQAKAITDRIARLANQIAAGGSNQANAATALGAGTADRPRTAAVNVLSGTATAGHSSYADDLRMGQDGHAKIIENLENTVTVHKENFQFAREVVKKYEETGEAWSFQRTGKFKIDVESWGFKNAEDYIASTRKDIEGYESTVISESEKVVEKARASRMEKLREYGLA